MEPQEPERLRGLASRAGRVDGAETGVVSPTAFFTGYRHDPERFYRLFDVYVLPSTREGFGVTLIEGMATGIPVVAYASAAPVRS